MEAMVRSALVRLAVVVLAIVGCGCSSHPTSSIIGCLIPPPKVVPKILQFGNSPADWESIPAAQSAANMVVGPDKGIWFDETGFVGRLDLATATIQTFAVSDLDGPYRITVGPDGAIWTCGTEIERVTTSGQVTNFPTAVECGGIAGGPDGFVYFSDLADTAIGKIASDGTITEIKTPESPIAVAIGSDGNIWFTEHDGRKGYSAIAKVDPAFTNITEYKDDDKTSFGGQTLVLGSDGRLYSETSTANLRAISTDGTLQVYKENGSVIQVASASGNNIWFEQLVSQTQNLVTSGWFNVRTHQVGSIDLTNAPCTDGGISPHVGPDMNVYSAGCSSINVFIRRILTVSPASATLAVGQTASFTISETGCSCSWTVKSEKKSVATVTQPQGGQFSVTAVKPGSATVTVADHKLNSFRVAITVQ